MVVNQDFNKEIYIKKKWEEENILYYLHFLNDYAVRQIEINHLGEYTFLSDDKPIKGDSILYDQKLSDLEIDKLDYIGEEEFNKVWKLHND